MREATLPPVQYIPREDAQMDLFDRTDHTSHCPYKGDATYWHVHAGGQQFDNAAWSYELPIAEAMKIAGYVCIAADGIDVELG